MRAITKSSNIVIFGLMFIFLTAGIMPLTADAFILPPKDFVFHCGGHVLYSNGVPAEGALVELYIQELGEQREYVDSMYVDENGYYSFSMEFDRRDPFVLMPHFIIKVRYYWNINQEEHIYTLGKVNCDFDIGIDQELRIAVFFYNNVDDYPVISYYGEYLKNDEDFDLVYYIPESPDWRSILRYIDTIETPNDHVFIYFDGHGAYHRPQTIFESGYSILWLDFDDHDNKMTSFELNKELDSFDTNSLIVMIEACYSGGFIDDCAGPNRCILTSTDKNHISVASEFTSNWFGNVRYMDQNELDAFYLARDSILDEYDGLMVPQCDHQLTTHWFEDW